MTSTLGSLIDARGCRMTLDEGEIASDVLVIARVHKRDGTVGLRVSESDGTDWITRRGLIEVALDTERGSGEFSAD